MGGFVQQKAEGKRTTYLYDDRWNELGNRLAAEGLIEYLQEHALL
jgi:hypothetical protein